MLYGLTVQFSRFVYFEAAACIGNQMDAAFGSRCRHVCKSHLYAISVIAVCGKA